MKNEQLLKLYEDYSRDNPALSNEKLPAYLMPKQFREYVRAHTFFQEAFYPKCKFSEVYGYDSYYNQETGRSLQVLYILLKHYIYMLSNRV